MINVNSEKCDSQQERGYSYNTSLEKTKKEITYKPRDNIDGKEISIFAADVSDL